MNRGIYIVVESKGEILSKSYWNEVSDLYQFLKNCFLKIEWNYDLPINSFSNELIPKHIIEALINQIEIELDELITINKIKETEGFTFIEENYKGESLQLYCKSSHLHHLIFLLLKTRKNLTEALYNNNSVYVIGNARMNEDLVNKLSELRYKNENKTIDFNGIDSKLIEELTKHNCIIREGQHYKFSLKGKTINIADE